MKSVFRPVLALSIALLGYTAAPGMSTEANADWKPSALAEEVFAIAADPGNDRTLYATAPSGLWKTTDGGVNWSLASGEKLRALAVDPRNPAILYASGNSAKGLWGIYKSTDEGKNWTMVRQGDSPTSIVIDPTNSAVYAGATVDFNYEILKSTDAVANWNRVLRPNEPFREWVGWVSALALSPSKPTTVYAGLAAGHGGRLVRSDDSGTTWRPIAYGGTLNPSFFSPNAVVADPRNPDIIYVGWNLMGSKKFLKSVDGGQSWDDLTMGLVEAGVRGWRAGQGRQLGLRALPLSTEGGGGTQRTQALLGLSPRSWPYSSTATGAFCPSSTNRQTSRARLRNAPLRTALPLLVYR